MRNSGYAAGLVLAGKPDCTAVLAANDCMANGVMMALRDKGLSVPDDVSVIGFDDELYKTIPNFDSDVGEVSPPQSGHPCALTRSSQV